MPKPVLLREPNWTFDEAELAAFGPRTRAVFLCHPNNPTGKVFTAGELALLGELCARWDAVLVVDSIYQHIHQLGPGGYLPSARIPGLEDWTITINSLSKTYAVTGWRVGWTVAPPELTAAICKVHDFLTIAAPAPLQAAAVAALELPPSYYTGLATAYRERRDLLCAALEDVRNRHGAPRRFIARSGVTFPGQRPRRRSCAACSPASSESSPWSSRASPSGRNPAQRGQFLSNRVA